MIRVTKLNGDEIVINDDLIEFVESTPDTIISLTDGKKIMVKEDPDEIIRRVAAFRRLASQIEYKIERNDK
ncbi:MAG: flagellar FlbD family protein [Candidatus Zixiibacteriota bacterium]|nr:MAG: flagellar FlbD family protein [candidate division Zixibacteria bacterium]